MCQTKVNAFEGYEFIFFLRWSEIDHFIQYQQSAVYLTARDVKKSSCCCNLYEFKGAIKKLSSPSGFLFVYFIFCLV
jgi:hypothetical protein